jgi:hypothetical protein
MRWQPPHSFSKMVGLALFPEVTRGVPGRVGAPAAQQEGDDRLRLSVVQAELGHVLDRLADRGHELRLLALPDDRVEVRGQVVALPADRVAAAAGSVSTSRPSRWEAAGKRCRRGR